MEKRLIACDRYLLDSGSEVTSNTYEVDYRGIPVTVKEIPYRGIKILSECEPRVARAIIDNWL